MPKVFATLFMLTLFCAACSGKHSNSGIGGNTLSAPDPFEAFWKEGSPVDGLWELRANQEEYTTIKDGKELFCPSFTRKFDIVIRNRVILNAASKTAVIVSEDRNFHFESRPRSALTQPGDKVRVTGKFEPNGLSGSGTLFFDFKIYSSSGPGCKSTFVLKRNPMRFGPKRITSDDNQLVTLRGTDRNCNPVRQSAVLAIKPEHGSIRRVEAPGTSAEFNHGTATNGKCKPKDFLTTRFLYTPNENYTGPDVALYLLPRGFIVSDYLYLPIMVE